MGFFLVLLLDFIRGLLVICIGNGLKVIRLFRLRKVRFGFLGEKVEF